MIRLLILMLLLTAAPVTAQDAEESDTTPTDTTETDDTEAEDDEALDDLDDLGELYPVEDEDEFIPSEDVAFGQSIPFPTDI